MLVIGGHQLDGESRAELPSSERGCGSWWPHSTCPRCCHPSLTVSVLRGLNRGFVCLRVCSQLSVPEWISAGDPRPCCTLNTCPHLMLEPQGSHSFPALCRRPTPFLSQAPVRCLLIPHVPAHLSHPL